MFSDISYLSVEALNQMCFDPLHFRETNYINVTVLIQHLTLNAVMPILTFSSGADC